ncbi:YggS family pyridoxal phosphate-dependent enzyme [Enterococcus bulliens]
MISENLRQVEQEIQDSCALASRQRNSVQLIAVTKASDARATQAIIDAGITHCGENRVDAFLAKKASVEAREQPLSWHFIGNLQRRKVKQVINEIDYFHALDSLRLAAEIQKRAEHTIACFVEVNVAKEASKQGISLEEVPDFIAQLAVYDRIQIVGLMMMAPIDATVEQLHELFHQLKQMQEQIAAQELSYAPCVELSMGMSNDYPIAIEEGATFIRIGTALFKE